MTGFTKLFASIITSSIWSEDDKVRVMWITMLASADARGYVSGSVPGMAAIARLTVADAEKAIDRLCSADPYSRSREHDGRRLLAIPGGWQVVNYIKYRQERDPETRREQNRQSQERWRKKHRQAKVSQNKPEVSRDKPRSAQAEAEEEAERNPPYPPPGDEAGANPDVLAVFNHWNSRAGTSVDKTDSDTGQPVHVCWPGRRLNPDGSIPPDAATVIRTALKQFTVKEICAAIDNYAAALVGEDTYWTYAWGLYEFFTRREGRALADGYKWWRFLPDGFDIEKYRCRRPADGALNLDGAPEDDVRAALGEE